MSLMHRAVSTLPVSVLQYDNGYGVSLRSACASSGCLPWSFKTVVSRLVMMPAIPMSCSRLVCHFCVLSGQGSGLVCLKVRFFEA